LFVTLEGGDGSGKSTQALRLAESLRELGFEVLLTREPGGSPLAEDVRRVLLDRGRDGMDPWAELLLFAGCRAEHRARVIAPALARRAWVVCDRYSDATVAYQAHGRGLPLPAVKEICRWAEQGVRPGLTLLLDVPVAEGLRRVGKRGDGATRFDAAPPEFHERVRRGYLEIAREEPARVAVVPASIAVDAVAARVMDAVRRRLLRKPAGGRGR
jgi:dTMP kinase